MESITYLNNLHLLAFTIKTEDAHFDQLTALDVRRVNNYFQSKGFKECTIIEQVEDVKVIEDKL